MASIKLDQTPMPPSSMQNKSLQERLLQALGFELLAILLCTPLFSWIMGTSWMRMGALTVASSAIAVLWNMIFNVVFDRLRWRHALPKGMGIDAIWRAAHAVPSCSTSACSCSSCPTPMPTTGPTTCCAKNRAQAVVEGAICAATSCNSRVGPSERESLCWRSSSVLARCHASGLVPPVPPSPGRGSVRKTGRV